MRALMAAISSGLCLLAVLACSSAKTPPVGRWEGAYEAQDVMVAVRLEISNKGEIFLSAPDLSDIQNTAADDRPALRERLAEDLSSSWGNVQARILDFDGRLFRKPGGIAPQMEWNPESKRMTVVLYLGTRSALRVPLHAVSEFTADPWTG